MSTELDQLLRDTVGEPSVLDVDELWQAGRRRRRLRHATAASSAVAMLVVVALGAGALAGGPGPGQVEIEPIAPPEVEPEPAPEEPAEEPEAAEEPEPVEPEVVEEEEEPEEEPPAEEPEAAEEPEPVEEPETYTAEAPVEEPAPSPQPDATWLASPCAPHEGREMDAFLDVVAPVNGQRVGGALDLVGCSNVYEATVRYRFTTPSGDLLADGFTTAACGSGCVGEVRDRVEVPAGSGEVVLTVFWEDVNDGSARDAVAMTLVRD